ncbi:MULTISPECIES: hypothetical protein [unclassified Mesorhizobium]|uniref:hypothetical protein n=1 Tax=unclassified Mesorhizobium TaxID=325217 RepID=UPI0010938688|nr:MULTISPECIES: hypothetical protein [unclassified Mesorhizobium]TGT90849.1 hypothetical protein EN804_05810 [Mesorhizobium sp. M8A.F.Ca.ET.161.01.1.1]TGV43872.1 hypothetical protein EN785_07740 [Mesorhizobium sp. M8A.F.Ca.ET.142.01.1.1]
MKKQDAKAEIEAAGFRPFEQRGFYSHFIRVIDDSKYPQGPTRSVGCIDVNLRGQVRKDTLDKILRAG